MQVAQLPDPLARREHIKIVQNVSAKQCSASSATSPPYAATGHWRSDCTPPVGKALVIACTTRDGLPAPAR